MKTKLLKDQYDKKFLRKLRAFLEITLSYENRLKKKDLFVIQSLKNCLKCLEDAHGK